MVIEATAADGAPGPWCPRGSPGPGAPGRLAGRPRHGRARVRRGRTDRGRPPPDVHRLPGARADRDAVTERLLPIRRPVDVAFETACRGRPIGSRRAGRQRLATAGIAPPAEPADVRCPWCASARVAMDVRSGRRSAARCSTAATAVSRSRRSSQSETSRPPRGRELSHERHAPVSAIHALLARRLLLRAGPLPSTHERPCVGGDPESPVGLTNAWDVMNDALHEVRPRPGAPPLDAASPSSPCPCSGSPRPAPPPGLEPTPSTAFLRRVLRRRPDRRGPANWPLTDGTLTLTI